jgi:DNA-binding NarL/FixJ family response regulator
MRVLIATNEPVLARGFEAILTSGGLEVVDVCIDIPHIIQTVQRCRPEAAILDMAVLPAQAVLIELRKLAPACQLLIWPRQISERQAKDLLRVGARAVLPGDVTPEVLLATDATPAALVNQVCNPLERQILSLIGCGMKNAEIAASVQATRRCVDQKVRILTQRLGVQDRYELALYGLSIAGEVIQSNGDQLWKNEIAIEWH